MKRHGSALPVVLVVLVIAASLGSTFYFTGRGNYRATALAAYRLRLQLVMVSALDEARSRLFQLTTPGEAARGLTIPEPALRDMILDQLPKAEEPLQSGDFTPYKNPPDPEWDPSTVDFTVPLDVYKGRDVLWATRAIGFADIPDGSDQDMGAVVIKKAVARLHGFRRVQFSDQVGRYPDPFDYYTSQMPFEDPQYIPRDYTGYCTVTIEAQLHSKNLQMQRQVSVTHDIKVTDTRPPARDFVLFSYRPTLTDRDRVFGALNDGGTDGARGRFDPNRPPTGRFILYPQFLGRVYIRGPYVMLTEGHTDGRGGRRPEVGPGYPQGLYNNWGGFGQVPGPRGIIMPAKRNITSPLEDQPSPLRPKLGCTDSDRDGSSSVGVPVVNRLVDFLATEDAVGWGQSSVYVAAGVGPNRQRMYLTGEPQYQGRNVSGRGTDMFRGVIFRNPFKKDRPEDESLLDIFAMDPAPDGTWTVGNIDDKDRIVPESGPFELGLYTVQKYYPFLAGTNCPKPPWWDENRSFGGKLLGAFDRGLHEVRGGFDTVTEVVSLGGISTEGYTRKWKAELDRDKTAQEQGYTYEDSRDPNRPDRRALEKLAEEKFGWPLGGPDPDKEETEEKWLERIGPAASLDFYSIHYEKPANQGWLNSWVNFGLDFALTAFMFLPGPGIVANLGLRGAMKGLASTGRKRAAVLVRQQLRKHSNIASDIVAGYAIDKPVLQGLMNAGGQAAVSTGLITPGQDPYQHLESLGASQHTSEQLVAALEAQREAAGDQQALEVARLLAETEGELPPEQDEIAEMVKEKLGTLEGVLLANKGLGETWDAGAGYLDSLMTGAPPIDGANADLFDAIRDTEVGINNRLNADLSEIRHQPFLGFLPPGLRPYSRLATRWHSKLEDTLNADGTLDLEGVLALDRFPEDYRNELRYRGRGILVSTDSDPQAGRQKPTFRGRIGPAVVGSPDHLTMVYWTQLAPKDATDKDGSGMIRLGADVNMASFVAPYGVQPLTAETGIKGNLVTQFIDRHRFPDRSNLRVYYRFDVLRPDLEEGSGIDSVHSPEDLATWTAVSVSPKIAGWHDSVQ